MNLNWVDPGTNFDTSPPAEQETRLAAKINSLLALGVMVAIPLGAEVRWRFANTHLWKVGVSTGQHYHHAGRADEELNVLLTVEDYGYNPGVAVDGSLLFVVSTLAHSPSLERLVEFANDGSGCAFVETVR